ncbi:MAG: baseplate J/gp47 family protein [Synechococcales cyanobacterium]
MSFPEPQFIDRDPVAITAEMIALWQSLTGKELLPAQPERLLIDLLAYRETLLRFAIQDAAKQNLLSYARGVNLDYLGELLGVERLPPQPALTTLRFTLDPILPTALVIPANTQVRDADGEFVFFTRRNLVIPPNTSFRSVAGVCSVPGTQANGLPADTLTELVSPIAGVSVTNTTITAGGAAAEDDARFRERIRLAPEAFSVAGPRGAYEFLARTASQNVRDVQVVSPAPTLVRVYVLMDTGIPTPDELALVRAVLTQETRRPLTDDVLVLPPREIAYQLQAQVTAYSTADLILLQEQLTLAAEAMVERVSSRLGVDLVPSQFVDALSLDGVYQVVVTSPALTVLTAREWARCTAISVQIVGVANG